ncbi:hypothetical protein [Aquimarina algicola]|uniref:DUF4303 domain-containing protein n=1 Tax=Aquimarina algicola TaxID=2589995 RepID=A0A504JBI2_9FLAO|nr:hypothetical protein [Aquimarina algicola]TPN88004.1 hypothetical protein FHK87_10555 [Aquimarina algicola]
MKWTEFESQFDLRNLIKNLTLDCLDNFFKDHQDVKIIAFGADCSAAYGDVFISILTENGVENVPKWKEDWEWIAEWDFWDLNGGFDDNESYASMKEKLDELMYDLEIDVFEELEKNFMNSVCEILIGIKAKYDSLTEAELIIRDHGDMTEESRERIKNAIANSI